jgi:hypothetical protein
MIYEYVNAVVAIVMFSYVAFLHRKIEIVKAPSFKTLSGWHNVQARLDAIRGKTTLSCWAKTPYHLVAMPLEQRVNDTWYWSMDISKPITVTGFIVADSNGNIFKDYEKAISGEYLDIIKFEFTQHHA